MVVTRGILKEATAFGPVFSSQVWSTIWLAMACPRKRESLGVSRWRIIGKKPNIFEKWWEGKIGAGLNCLAVREASSNAVKRPKMVTARAASLRNGGIDIIGVFKGVMFEVRISPARILPQAKRLMGLITAGLFSLMGERGLKRGWPMETKKTTRRL